MLLRLTLIRYAARIAADAFDFMSDDRMPNYFDVSLRIFRLTDIVAGRAGHYASMQFELRRSPLLMPGLRRRETR